MSKEKNKELINAFFTRVKKTTSEKVDECREYLKDMITEQQEKAACIVALTPEAANKVSEFAKSLELPKDAAASMMIKLCDKSALDEVRELEKENSDNNLFRLDDDVLSHLIRVSKKYGFSLDETLKTIIYMESYKDDEFDVSNDADNNDISNNTNSNIVINVFESDIESNNEPCCEESSKVVEDVNDKTEYVEECETNQYSSLSKKELTALIIELVKDEKVEDEIKEILNISDGLYNEIMLELSSLSDSELLKFNEDEFSINEVTPEESVVIELSYREKIMGEMLLYMCEGLPLSDTLDKLGIEKEDYMMLCEELNNMPVEENYRILESYIMSNSGSSYKIPNVDIKSILSKNLEVQDDSNALVILSDEEIKMAKIIIGHREFKMINEVIEDSCIDYEEYEVLYDKAMSLPYSEQNRLLEEYTSI